MLEKKWKEGGAAARELLKLSNEEAGMLSGLLGKAKSFGAGQLQAGKDLFSNLRGGLGGQMNPDVLPHSDPAMARAAHRQRALGNLKTLAPTLAAGGGLYMLHRHNQQQEEQQRQQQMMMQQGGYGQPMM